MKHIGQFEYKKPAIDPSALEGPMAGSGNLSEVLDDQRTLTAHRPTVPPSGERTVIVVIAIAVADHFVQKGRSPNATAEYLRPFAAVKR